MANLPVDRDKNYMYQMWGTTNLVTDYDTKFDKRTIQEIMHDDVPRNKHFLKEQAEIHYLNLFLKLLRVLKVIFGVF